MLTMYRQDKPPRVIPIGVGWRSELVRVPPVKGGRVRCPHWACQHIGTCVDRATRGAS